MEVRSSHTQMRGNVQLVPLKASCLHVRLENLRIWDEMLTVVDRAGTRSKKIKSLYMFKQRNSTSHRLKREEGGRLGNLASFVPFFFAKQNMIRTPLFFLLHPYQQHWTTSNQGGCNYYIVWAYRNNIDKNVPAQLTGSKNDLTLTNRKNYVIQSKVGGR